MIKYNKNALGLLPTLWVGDSLPIAREIFEMLEDPTPKELGELTGALSHTMQGVADMLKLSDCGEYVIGFGDTKAGSLALGDNDYYTFFHGDKVYCYDNSRSLMFSEFKRHGIDGRALEYIDMVALDETSIGKTLPLHTIYETMGTVRNDETVHFYTGASYTRGFVNEATGEVTPTMVNHLTFDASYRRSNYIWYRDGKKVGCFQAGKDIGELNSYTYILGNLESVKLASIMNKLKLFKNHIVVDLREYRNESTLHGYRNGLATREKFGIDAATHSIEILSTGMLFVTASFLKGLLEGCLPKHKDSKSFLATIDAGGLNNASKEQLDKLAMYYYHKPKIEI